MPLPAYLYKQFDFGKNLYRDKQNKTRKRDERE